MFQLAKQLLNNREGENHVSVKQRILICGCASACSLFQTLGVWTVFLQLYVNKAFFLFVTCLPVCFAIATLAHTLCSYLQTLAYGSVNLSVWGR